MAPHRNGVKIKSIKMDTTTSFGGADNSVASFLNNIYVLSSNINLPSYFEFLQIESIQNGLQTALRHFFSVLRNYVVLEQEQARLHLVSHDLSEHIDTGRGGPEGQTKVKRFRL